MNRTKKYFFYILLLAVMIRLLFFSMVALSPNFVMIINDSEGYDRLALNLINGDGFSCSEGYPFHSEDNITPLYPLFLAGIYLIFGHAPLVASFIQILLSLAIIVISYKIAGKFFNPAICLLTALFLAVDSGSISYSTQLMTDTLFSFLFILFCYFLIIAFEKNSFSCFVFSGILLGLSTLCRTISLYLPLFLVFIFFFYYRKNLAGGLLKFLILLVSFLLVLSPWFMRNYMTFGRAFFSNRANYNLLYYNVNSLRTYRKKIPFKNINRAMFYTMRAEVQEELAQKNLRLTQDEMAIYHRNKALKEISKYPLEYAIVHLSGILPLFMDTNTRILYVMTFLYPNSISSMYHRASKEDFFIKLYSFFPKIVQLEIVFFIILYLLGLLGLLISCKKKNYFIVIISLAIIFYGIITTGPPGGERFRIPFIPFVFMFVSCGLYYTIIKIASIQKYLFKKNRSDVE